jgi:parvulin-like peptidyl-prolyl isomerase
MELGVFMWQGVRRGYFRGGSKAALMAFWLVFPAQSVLAQQEHEPAGSEQEQTESGAIDPDSAFATINQTVITVAEYARELRREARETFYHGQPPGGDMAGFQREVADRLVERVLMAGEARRRGLEPDNARVQEALGRLAARGLSEEALTHERWRLQQRSLVSQLEAQVQALASPSREEVRSFYEENPELFTEPAKLKLSVILLRVMPEDPQSVWKAAREEADGLLERLRNGADFAEMARIHSGDSTAEAGGDMGYVHMGMLAPEIEKAAREMAPGELSEPLMVLEGVALVRLEARQEPRLQDFASVAERAEGLLERERAEAALTALRNNLREAAEVSLREELLEPDGDAPGGPASG